MARTKGSRSAGYVVAWYGDEILQALAAEIDEAVFDAGEVLIERATAKAPRAQGTLQDSGYVATVKKSSYKTKPHHKREVRPRGDGVAVVTFSAPHAHLVEFGTVKMSAQPFFRPAFDESKEKMADAAVVTLKAGLQKRGRR